WASSPPRVARRRCAPSRGSLWALSLAGSRLFLAGAREQEALALLLFLVLATRIEQMLRELGEAAFAYARIARFGPALEDLVLERAVWLPGAEDLLDLADDELEHADLSVEDLEHVGLDRAASDQIDHPHRMLLAETMHAPDPLLHTHRIPRQV